MRTVSNPGRDAEELSVGSRILSDAASKHHIAPTIFSLEMGNLSLFLRLFEMLCAIW